MRGREDLGTMTREGGRFGGFYEGERGFGGFYEGEG